MSIKDQHNCIDANELHKITKINIEKYQLQVIVVTSTSYLPSFGYSIGLWEQYKHPEIICFGLSNGLLHEIINDVAVIIKNNAALIPGKDYLNIFGNNSRATFLKVDPENISDYLNVAIKYYDTIDLPVLQLIWTDRNDKFPWENGFEEEFLYDQPLLDRNTDFKFKEPKNLTTFTTRQWIELKKPILRVVHDDDGDWQFLTGDQMPDDISIVALEQLILSDKTLNEVFDLEYGEAAEREFVGGKWTRNRVEAEEE